MKETMNRREFVKYAGGGIATLLIGSMMPSWISGDSQLANTTVLAQELKFTITDAMKNMVTHNSENKAQCYFWLYKEENFPAEIPGPNIITTVGSTVKVTVTNALDEPHAFYISGLVDTGPIRPGETKTVEFVPDAAGTYLYYDNLNAPVNRMMGLHGALVVMPNEPVGGHNYTPYSNPTPAVQQLFDDLGSSEHFPGLSWEEGDPASHTPAFRQYIWILHEASSRLFTEVGNYTAGKDYPAAQFVKSFQTDRFRSDGKNKKPEFFTINGQSGYFAAHNPYIAPNHRVGEPAIIRILNAGLSMHSLHLHGNHVYVTGVNGEAMDNVIWLDTYTSNPLETVEWVVPFTRPPDIPNVRGIGLADEPLMSIGNPAIPGSAPHPVWPPTDELNMHFPEIGTRTGNFDISVRLSPICYPMHDHAETSQSAQGGNYGLGMMSGLAIIGDRNTPEGVITFPNSPTNHGPEFTGPAAGYGNGSMQMKSSEAAGQGNQIEPKPPENGSHKGGH
ncbi:multicopper oxidase domain-containing protein [Neobacillus sp. SCS-31]|uniref:multicopper oxidase domain-containing protein n=1 Tax=Neobacillus oceani TaxID=3115292 RepID=UPI0039058BE1